jgi:hypothetical protein
MSTMASIIHLVVIGAAGKGPDPRYSIETQSVPTIPSHLPTADNLNRGIQLASDSGYDLKVYLIDNVFEYRTLPDDKDKILSYPENTVTVSSLNANEFDITDEKNTPNLLRTTEQPVIIISYAGDRDTFEVMSRFGSFNAINRAFAIGKIESDELYVDIIIAESINFFGGYSIEQNTFNYIPANIYDLVSGSKVPENISDYDLKALVYHLTALIDITTNYISAGFLDNTVWVNSIDKSWYMNVETLILASFFDKYQPEMQAKDKDIQSTFLINASFRRNVTIGLIGVISNFMVHNSLITPNEIVETGGYVKTSFYTVSKQRLLDFKIKTSHSTLD